MDLHPPPKPAIILPRRRELIRPDCPRFHLDKPWNAMLMGGLGVTAASVGGNTDVSPYRAFQGTYAGNSSLGTVTLGVELPNRTLVVLLYASHTSASNFTGGTLNGAAGTRRYTAGLGLSSLHVWTFNPTGTSGALTFSGASGTTTCQASVWALYNLTSSTPIQANGDAAGATNPVSLALTTVADSICVALAMRNANNGGSWSSVTLDANTFSTWMSSAASQASLPASSVTPACTFSANAFAMTAATFR